jgi:dolichol-phosphate mannosyltransferase
MKLKKNDFLVSLIVPVYNEEKNILPFLKRLKPILNQYQSEIIFVDDGSSDTSISLLKQEAATNHQLKVISFYRNFGHQKALSCGYQFAKGDCVISMDADLQDPPEIIPSMIDRWQKGAKVVYAKRSTREVDSFFKQQTANLFYRFINFLSDTPIPNNVGDYRLLDREVVNFINILPEQARFLRGLVAWGNYPSEYVYFKREKRFAGKTNYTLSKMINFALDGIISFSVKPLKIASYFGFASAGLGFLGIVYAILGRIFLPRYWVTGWTALFVGIMFLGGIQLLTIGIIGEYIGRIYQEIQHRPHYLIKEKINL